MLSITKRGRSDSHLLVQKGTKNRDKPPIEVTVTQGISVIVRGPGIRSLTPPDVSRPIGINHDAFCASKKILTNLEFLVKKRKIAR